MLVPTYTMLGHGPVVLMLHGAGGGFRSFAPQVETLASLGFRAVAWNMPGYGPSPPIEPYSFKGLAERAVALIESLAPVTDGAPVALLGHGMGGMVAQEVTLRRPDLIGQLVLVATAAAVQPGDGYNRYVEQGLAWLAEGRPMSEIADTLLPRLVGLSHALDLIMTGRKVEAEEALRMGLCNRVVPAGQALEAALALAHQLAAFPQPTLRADRASALAAEGVPLQQALLQEWAGGRECLAEALRGASRFAAGQGRHGQF